MADFAEGPGSIEVAAQEDGQLDPTPLRLDFTYKPDYERMVTRRLERIDAANPRAMRNALRELKPLGSKILPTIRRQAKTARAAAQRAAMLEQFLHELETSEEQSEGAKEEVPE